MIKKSEKVNCNCSLRKNLQSADASVKKGKKNNSVGIAVAYSTVKDIAIGSEGSGFGPLTCQIEHRIPTARYRCDGSSEFEVVLAGW